MKAPIRTLIADDESAARRRLSHFLSSAADVQLIAECSDGLQAANAIGQLRPDLVFLDVEMPECSGLDVIAKLGIQTMPATILVTAHEHYALPAFEANVLDYLLKPFDGERLDRALAKARAWIGMRSAAALSQGAAPLQRILVRSGSNQQLLNLADVAYISAEGNYLRLHTASGSHQLRQRMVGILEKLDPASFRRIHRSHIVNLDHVSKLLPWYGGDCLVLMKDGCRLTLSRSYRHALKEFV